MCHHYEKCETKELVSSVPPEDPGSFTSLLDAFTRGKGGRHLALFFFLINKIA